MPPVIATIYVDRAAADVFAYATDPARFHEWQAGVTEGHLDRPGPVEAGARCLTTRRIGGANRAVTSEVTHVDPPRTWGVRGIDGPIRAAVDLTVEPQGDDHPWRRIPRQLDSPVPWLRCGACDRREAAERERRLRRDGEGGESRADPNPARAAGIL
jgi:uncharacterized protein YndB with AHSA1/START domain